MNSTIHQKLPAVQTVQRGIWMSIIFVAASWGILWVDGASADSIMAIWAITILGSILILLIGFPYRFGIIAPPALTLVTIPIFTAGLIANGWTESNPAPKSYWGMLILHFIIVAVIIRVENIRKLS